MSPTKIKKKKCKPPQIKIKTNHAWKNNQYNNIQNSQLHLIINPLTKICPLNQLFCLLRWYIFLHFDSSIVTNASERWIARWAFQHMWEVCNVLMERRGKKIKIKYYQNHYLSSPSPWQSNYCNASISRKNIWKFFSSVHQFDSLLIGLNNLQD